MTKSIVDIAIAEVDEIKALRYAVLWPHLDGSEACEIAPDRLDTTFHLAAYENDEVVGTATFLVENKPDFKTGLHYRLRAMATAPKVRTQGVGARLIKEGIKQLKLRNADLLWCDARLTATGFYEKQKFRVKGKVYEVPKIGPHKLMYIELKKTKNGK